MKWSTGIISELGAAIELMKSLCQRWFDDLQDRLPYIAKELADKDKTHVTRYLLWEEYKKDNPDGYEYTQFCFHVNQYTDAQKPSFIMKQ